MGADASGDGHGEGWRVVSRGRNFNETRYGRELSRARAARWCNRPVEGGTCAHDKPCPIHDPRPANELRPLEEDGADWRLP